MFMMKPFEERLTAWIDDALTGDELAAFERELAAHPEAESLRLEKRVAHQLRALLREHLPAAVPALGNNADFFNHQLRERLLAETAGKPRETAAHGNAWSRWLRLFWNGGQSGAGLTPSRLLLAGAACLLAGALGTYALIPTQTPSSSNGPVAAVDPAAAPPAKAPAVNSTAPVVPVAPASQNAVAASSPAPAPPRGVVPAAENGRTEMAVLESTQREPRLSGIVNARVPEGTATAVTPVHFDDQNADVLWLDGLEDLPAAEVEGSAPALAVPTSGQHQQ